MDSDGSEFYYPDEIKNKKKLHIAAIGNKENQQNFDAFTMANVRNYIFSSMNGKHS